jgi:hypothetical protein
VHIAQKFERLLGTYRRPDGSRRTGQQIDETTGGVVTRSYVTNLRKGRIESPPTGSLWKPCATRRSGRRPGVCSTVRPRRPHPSCYQRYLTMMLCVYFNVRTY